ncbi:MAG: RNA-binding S4 domain-containing protein [Prolixibacteraceae bacterium]|nr:RNA-binding S4 domain-containing protein [Prolixibacteraceae bacterium]
MKTEEFALKSDYIELIKLLKLLRIAESGGHAKQLVEGKQVLVNGMTELRKRAKLRQGDIVEIFETRVKIR